jgi:polyisoprenoid-binding protein YceI
MSADLIEIPGYIAGTWTIDPTHADVGFVSRHLMISKIKGHFTRSAASRTQPATSPTTAFSKFEGRIVTADDPLKSEVTATIDMTSIDTASVQRDEHLRNART